MSVRLAFAVTVEVDADILLIDEVLAVGDAAFQQKCFEQFEQLKREGRTIVLVTHDMSAVERFCDRAMLIDRGTHARASASPHEIALAYNELNFGRLVERGRRAREGRYGDHAAAEIKAAWFEDDARRADQGPGAGPAVHDVRWTCSSTRAMEEPIFAFHLRNEPRHIVFVDVVGLARRSASGRFAAGETARVQRALRELARAEPLHGQPVGGPRRAPATTCVDLREDLASIVVHGTRVTGGIADVPHELRRWSA